MNRGSFDPYYHWLGIPLRDQPPHLYRLLGIELFETDPEIVRSAADRRLTYIRKYQLGQHSELSQQLLDLIVEARECLLDPATRRPCDELLEAQLGKRRAASRHNRSHDQRREERSTPTGVAGASGSMGEAGDPPFDPYYKWLGIAPWKQPHHHYQLLGLERFESDPQIIRVAAEQQLAYVSKYRTGRYADYAARLLEELREAQACLLSPAMKAGYDEGLRESLRPPRPVAAVPGAAAPGIAAPGLSAPGHSTPGLSAPAASFALPLFPAAPPRPRWRLGKWLAAHRQAIGVGALTTFVSVAVALVVLLSRPDPNFDVAEDEPGSSFSPAAVRPRSPAPVDSAPLVTAAEPPPSLPSAEPVINAGNAAVAPGPSRVHALRPAVTEPEPAVNAAVEPPPADKSATAAAPEQEKLPGAASAPVGEKGGNVKAEPATRPEGTPPVQDVAVARSLKPGAPVNLLQQIDLKRDMIAGKWKFDHGVLVSPPKSFHARVQLQAAVPAEYTLEAVVERSRGTNRAAIQTLAFGLVIGDSQTLVTIDATGATGFQFQEGKPSVITCTVRSDEVQVLFDGRRIVHWTRFSEQLTLPSLWAVPDKSALFIGTDSGYRIRSLTLRPLE